MTETDIRRYAVAEVLDALLPEGAIPEAAFATAVDLLVEVCS